MQTRYAIIKLREEYRTKKINLKILSIEGRRRKGQQKMRWLNGITNIMDMSVSKLQEIVKDGGDLACHSPLGREESLTT